MKKFFISLLILITGAVCFAESDLQISTQPFSLYQAKHIAWNNVRYRESLFFQYSGSIIEVKNHNFLWGNQKFGFYESAAVFVNRGFGVELAVGPCVKFYENKKTLFTGDLGVHVSLYHIEHIDFGIESDFRIKLLKNRKFSPVLGLSLSFDFLTTGNSDDVMNSGISALINSMVTPPAVEKIKDGYIFRDVIVNYDKTVKEYFAFYVKPYIGCTWNF